MKVLYIDVELAGHHLPYLKSAACDENENVYVIPEKTSELKGKQYQLNFDYHQYNIYSYLKWIREIKEIIKKEKIEIVHFVYADVLLKYFGLGINGFGNAKVILSFHRVENQTVKNIARNILASKSEAITSHIIEGELVLRKTLRKKHYFVAYPSAYENITISKVQAKNDLGINTDLPVIASIGKLSSYKGMDSLFAALSFVRREYYLLIAGKPEYYTKDYITSETEKLNAKSKLILDYISDEDFVRCIAASDIIAVTYDKSFEGTSGPMTEGIRLKKTIVGCNHSNIGKYIQKYNIGYSADANDIKAMAEAFEKALAMPAYYDEHTDDLIKMQTINGFRERLMYIYHH